jgi:subtilisin family serine protease
MKRFSAIGLVILFGVAACGDLPNAPGAVDAPQFGAGAAAQDYAEGRLLARFQPGAQRAAIAAAHGASFEREIALGIAMLRVQPGRELQVAAALSRNPGVEWAEPDFIRTFGEPCKLGSCQTPNDPFFGYKWDLHNNGSITNSSGTFLTSTGAAGADMDWLEAYNHLGTATGSAVKLGILDTGIRADHVEFTGRIAAQFNFHSNTANAADDDGHGTHVAGISTARGNDGAGVPGVAYGANVQLVVAKVCGPLSPPRFGQTYGCYSSSIVNGIKWTADQGAAVMNLSLGGSSASTAEQEALQYARSKGSLPICAAGNNGQNSVSYPARFPECVAVSATNWNDGLASYSNYGPEIELSAPGGDSGDPNGYSYILSAYHSSSTSYAFMAGTSMASPQVAGLAVLLHALGMTDHGTKLAHMKSTANDLGPAGWDQRFGSGRINVYNAVAGGSPPPVNNPPTASFTFSCASLTCSFTDTSTDSDGSVVAWSWSFGDGATSNAQHPSRTYAAAGTYTVSLTVTDDKGATGSTSQSVTVSAPPPSGFTLSVRAYKVQGLQKADLTWSGASAASIDVYRNGTRIATVANSGAHTDAINNRGAGSYTYRVCDAGTSTCSNDVTVTF